jgi:hypothetical protein
LSGLILGLNNEQQTDQLRALPPVGWKEKSNDLPGCYFLEPARIPNEDATYPKIFLDMVFLRSTGHLAKPRNVDKLR